METAKRFLKRTFCCGAALMLTASAAACGQAEPVQRVKSCESRSLF